MSKLSPAISESLSRAFSAYNAGKLIEAENLCQQIIAAKPEFFDAIIVLAMVQSRLGKKELALTTAHSPRGRMTPRRCSIVATACMS